MTAFQELLDYQVFEEFARISQSDMNDTINQVKFKIIKYMIVAATHDPKDGVLKRHEYLINDVKSAGQQLYQIGGTNKMYEPDVWKYITPTFQRIVECYWSGIGDWQW